MVEGKLGSVRFFCVDMTFQRLYVGKRLLYRLEKTLKAAGCVRVMFSVPSPRERVAKWLSYQGYDHINSIPYPTAYLHHKLVDGIDVKLDMYAKPLVEGAEKVDDNTAQAKIPADTPQNVEGPSTVNTHLPPHWRGIRNYDLGTAAESAPSVSGKLNANSLCESGDDVDGVHIPDVD